MHHLKLVLTGPGRGEVFLDGKKIDYVTAVKIEAAVGEINTATLVLNVRGLEVEGDVGLVEITDISSDSRTFANAGEVRVP